MIRSLTGLALRFFGANKFLTISTLVSIGLSVFLVITMTVFSANARLSIEQDSRQLFGEMDISAGYKPDSTKVIDAGMLRQMTSDPAIGQHSAVIIDRFSIDTLGRGMYTVGVGNDELAKSVYHFTADLGPSDVILNAALADALELKAGDQVSIHDRSFRLAETVEEWRPATLDMIILPRETVREMSNPVTKAGREATYVLIKAAQHADIEALARSLHQLDSELRIDLANENEFLTANLNSLRVFMIVLSVLVLIISSLFILSNSETFAYKYRNQMAIMRAIGASRGQLFRVALLQNTMLNAAGMLLGLMLAWIGSRITQTWLAGLFSQEMDTTSFSLAEALPAMLLSGLLIQVFMFIPSYKNANVLPMKIVENNENNDFVYKRAGKLLGFILLGTGLFSLVTGLTADPGDGSSALYILLAAVLIILAAYRLFSLYVPVVLRSLGPLLKVGAGNLSFVAVRNMIPQVRRNTFVILTISTLMIITVFGTTLFETIKVNDAKWLKQQHPTNIVIKNRGGVELGLGPKELSRDVQEAAGVEIVSAISEPAGFTPEGSETDFYYSYAFANLEGLERQGLLKLAEDTDNKGRVVITRKLAEAHQLGIGDQVRLDVSGYRKRTTGEPLVVAGIAEELPGSHYDAYLDWSMTSYARAEMVLSKLLVHAGQEEQAMRQLEELKAKYPAQLSISSYKQAVAKSNEMFLQRWSIFIAVLVTILITVMIGICNTMINHIQTKRREYAILRTLSVTSRGLRRVVLTQVLLYVSIGLALGIVLGVLTSYILGFIDPSGGLIFNFRLAGMMSLATIGIACAVFIPYAGMLSRRKLVAELSRDNK
ncbi:ABC transporter permease [Paenibacillus sambharensis]|uniref:ABC transporter permease n=1 Tax=Paenibacillus sambharensis TaxID=1803190 RepID=A0A2W1LST8_9BACL|nr:ABC transporter permease [Paenibacillus sambharensis]PZD97554.1 ABC transporter permease [Paenibacillus sambharensis]